MMRAALVLAGLCALAPAAALSADPLRSGDARLAAEMRGCWDLVPEGELALHVETMAKEGWGFSHSVCLGGAPQGEMLTWTMDAGDGWDGSTAFEIVDGKLVRNWSSTAGTRCDVRVEVNSMSWTNCVKLSPAEHGGLVEGESDEPSTFVRDPDMEASVFSDPFYRDWLAD
jgi:hypothetical protein